MKNKEIREAIASAKIRYWQVAEAHLTADQRAAVVLRHCRGLTLDQTAARMRTTRAQARTAEQKGLRRLRHPSISRELRQYV